MTPEYNYLFKFLIIGDVGVGKSSILSFYKNNIYTYQYIPTIGIDIKTTNIESDDKIIRLHIMDISGNIHYRTTIPIYYRGINGIIVMYDITNRESFDNLPQWFDEIDRYANDNISKILVGNKSDLLSDRTISYNEAKEYADIMGIQYIESSVENNYNIEQIFLSLTKITFNKISNSSFDNLLDSQSDSQSDSQYDNLLDSPSDSSFNNLLDDCSHKSSNKSSNKKSSNNKLFNKLTNKKSLFGKCWKNN
jgi:Ras-related protein Rab-1A